MNHFTKSQMGSKSRDTFKWLHKQLLGKDAWALNSDLELVDKHPDPFIVARLDFKVGNDSISFTEAISYSVFINMPEPHRIPVYIVYTDRLFKAHAENSELTPDERIALAKEHKFTVKELLFANPFPNPPKTEERLVLENASWHEFSEWEKQLRMFRRQERIRLKRTASTGLLAPVIARVKERA